MLMMAAVAIVTMTSCSDDSNSNTDDNNDNTDNTLLKKEVVDYTSSGTDYTATYSYFGNKLVQVSYGDGTYNKATYTDNNLTKYEMCSGNDVMRDVIFEYDGNNKLIKTSERTFNNSGTEPVVMGIRMREFTYQDDNTIAFNEYNGTSVNNLTAGVTGSYKFNNGNLVRLVRGDTDENMVFDTKNSPYKNILGMDKLAMVDQFFGPKNNLTSYSYVTPMTNHVWNTTYTYNANNYPVTGTTTGFYANTTQYFYE